MQKSYLFSMKLGTREFLKSLMTNLKTNSDVKTEGSNMADQDIKLLDLDEPRVLRSLIMNVNSKCSDLR